MVISCTGCSMPTPRSHNVSSKVKLCTPNVTTTTRIDTILSNPLPLYFVCRAYISVGLSCSLTLSLSLSLPRFFRMPDCQYPMYYVDHPLAIFSRTGFLPQTMFCICSTCRSIQQQKTNATTIPCVRRSNRSQSLDLCILFPNGVSQCVKL